MSFSTLWRILFLALLWGPSFLFIKVAVREVPPLTTAFLRVSIATVLLLAALKWKKRELPPFGKIWWHFVFMGLASNALPFFLFCFGELSINSSLAALINGSPAIFTAILAHFFLADEPLNRQKVAGVLIGLLGLVVLFLPSLLKGIHGTVWGILAVIAATFCYAVGFIYAKRNLKGVTPLVAPASQLFMASLFLLPFSLAVDHPWELPFPSFKAALSIFCLASFGTALAFIFCYKILEIAGATALSMVSYLLPVMGTLIGLIFLDEPLAWNNLLGGCLILFAMLVVNKVVDFSALGERLKLSRIGKKEKVGEID